MTLYKNVGGEQVAMSAEEEAATLAEWEANAPQPPRRKVLKSTVVARLIAADKIDAAFSALNANKGAFARWFSPDHPAIYADDPEALALLAAIQADPAVIMAPDRHADGRGEPTASRTAQRQARPVRGRAGAAGGAS